MTQPLALSSGEAKVRGHAPRWLNRDGLPAAALRAAARIAQSQARQQR